MAGYDPKDAGSLRDPVPDFVAALDRGVEGLRFGWSADFGYTPVDREVAQSAEAGARAFEDMGCSVEESSLALEISVRYLDGFLWRQRLRGEWPPVGRPGRSADLVRALDY